MLRRSSLRSSPDASTLPSVPSGRRLGRERRQERFHQLAVFVVVEVRLDHLARAGNRQFNGFLAKLSDRLVALAGDVLFSTLQQLLLLRARLLQEVAS